METKTLRGTIMTQPEWHRVKGNMAIRAVDLKAAGIENIKVSITKAVATDYPGAYPTN